MSTTSAEFEKATDYSYRDRPSRRYSTTASPTSTASGNRSPVWITADCHPTYTANTVYSTAGFGA